MQNEKINGEILEVHWSHPTLGKGILYPAREENPYYIQEPPVHEITFICGKSKNKFNFKSLLPVWWP